MNRSWRSAYREGTGRLRIPCVHIATNEVLMTKLLKEIADGVSSGLSADFDNQRFNEEQVTLGRKKSMAEIRPEPRCEFRQPDYGTRNDYT